MSQLSWLPSEALKPTALDAAKIGALIITNTIWGVPYYDYSVRYPETLLTIKAPILRPSWCRPRGASLPVPHHLWKPGSIWLRCGLNWGRKHFASGVGIDTHTTTLTVFLIVLKYSRTATLQYVVSRPGALRPSKPQTGSANSRFGAASFASAQFFKGFSAHEFKI